MNKYLSSLLCILGLTSCNSSNIKNDIYLYNTVEYNELIKSANFSLKEAKQIICKEYRDKIILDENDKKFDKNNHFPIFKNKPLRHYLIYKDNYIFVDAFLPPTHAGTLLIEEGIYINIYTGELLQKPYKMGEGVSVKINDYTDIKCID